MATDAEKLIKASRRTELEDLFLAIWERDAPTFPLPDREVLFSLDREFPFDFAWIDPLVAVEVQGGTWMGGAHSRGYGQTRDAIKGNLATLAGWRVFYATSDMLKDDPESFVKTIKQALDVPPSPAFHWVVAKTRNLEIGSRFLFHETEVRRTEKLKFGVRKNGTLEFFTDRSAKRLHPKVVRAAMIP